LINTKNAQSAKADLISNISQGNMEQDGMNAVVSGKNNLKTKQNKTRV